MWDLICNESMRTRANARFEALSSSVRNGKPEFPVALKFDNTFDSAMSILNSIPPDAPKPQMQFLDGGYELYTYSTLRDRFVSLHQRRQFIMEDIGEQATSGDSSATDYLLGLNDDIDDDLLNFGLEILAVQAELQKHIPTNAEVPGFMDDPDYKWYYVPREALRQSLRKDLGWVEATVNDLQSTKVSRRLRAIQRNAKLAIHQTLATVFDRRRKDG
ncbi:hypothetical protein CVT24_012301 [Panaeolus cyanescens]|uniref:Uncharacterized protein n=1 Tax=Panaeolus cyanescens TaxID=181874 RepID=A0A409W4A8_9AGAR|nr:hypothetical protein CVT24_012301 [Panaeolus cyanescens]